jgi:hypothetical protein
MDKITTADKWEIFCDPAYYHMWCVRHVGETRFGEGFHVPSKEEAEALKAELEGNHSRPLRVGPPPTSSQAAQES